jgi:predicted transcriptional regulator
MSEIKYFKSLMHYGTKKHSGRYPWGSGEDPQHSKSFRTRVNELKKEGYSEAEVAKMLNMSTTKMRAQISLEKSQSIQSDYVQALSLKEKGYSNKKIAEIMGKPGESSIRALINPVLQERAKITGVVSDILKTSIEKGKYIDVGLGSEQYLGVSRTRLNNAISKLKDEGYNLYYVKTMQLGTGKNTNIKVLTAPDVKFPEVAQNKDKIKMVTEYHSPDGGRSFQGIEPIQHISSKRVKIRYAEEGGTSKDGVIELRRNVPDLSLGNSNYAQVRIGVDGTHYLKGMAIYSDDIPKGVDVVFNTNKKSGTPKMDVLKPLKNDPENPFGATIKANGRRKAINIVNEEGDWGEWSKNLSSQMLSKQGTALAKKQLDMAFDSKMDEYKEIMSLTNPTVKKRLLMSFADDCDSATSHLKAAALPRQGSHVILPLKNIKEDQIYAPNYNDGERVVLIRYPHGGIFEIPELTVNNKNVEGKKVLGRAKDAVGIHSKVAEKLSGADFDGDTVLVIPNDPKKVGIKSMGSLEKLKDFDPKETYKAYEGMPKVGPETGFYKQRQMGSISNLITDMTVRGADWGEIARAVRHSMVVIDAEKHNLNYKESYVHNGIAALKTKYQGGPNKGASTLISRASSEARVPFRKDRPANKETGEKMYEYTNEVYIKPKLSLYKKPLNQLTKEEKDEVYRQGTPTKKTMKSTKMLEVKDAFELTSGGLTSKGTLIETVYANHANKLKKLANDARKVSVNTDNLEYSATANKVYSKEVDSLKAKLNLAYKNKPLERQAQLLANKIVAEKKETNLYVDADDVKKLQSWALNEARVRTGAKKFDVVFSDREWEAVQNGAISPSLLTEIIKNTDLDRLKALATPRTKTTITKQKEQRIISMLNNGYSQSEIASQLGVSVNTVKQFM